MGPKLGRLSLKQFTIDWSATDKYRELRNFRFEVNNICQTYDTNNADRVSIIKNWLGRQALQYNKFRPQLNETILTLQYCYLSRHSKENAKQWMGRLRMMAGECKYKELDRYLKEQFICGLNGDGMMVEIIWELTSMVDTRNNKCTCIDMGKKSGGS